MAQNGMDLDDLTLGQLGQRNDFLKNQLEGLNKGARAMGGTGDNKRDEQAREFSQKQLAVESEIDQRLFGIHQERSMLAQETDEQRKAPRADNPQQWADNPALFDWPGIDTPRK